MTEGYGFDPAFEAAVVLTLTQSHRFYGMAGHYVDPELLSCKEASWLCTAAHAVYKDSGRGPESSILVVQRLRRWMNAGRLTFEALEAAVNYLNRAEDDGLPNEDAILVELVPVLKRRYEHRVARAGLDNYSKRGDFGEVVKLLEEARRIGENDVSLGSQLGSDSFRDIEALRHLDRLPTGIDDLDLAMSGGMPRGLTGVVMGGTGEGKSMFLSQVASYNLLNGLMVCYAVVSDLDEADVKARMIANLTGTPIDAVMAGSDEARFRLAALEPKLGIGMVKEFTEDVTAVADILEWVSACQDYHGRRCDLLVVDYADRLAAPAEKSEYNAMKVVYEALRKAGKRDKRWTWTASQSRDRDEKSKRIKTHRDAADSINKARVVDAWITLNVWESESSPTGLDQYFFISKFRKGRARVKVGPLEVEYELGRVAPSRTLEKLHQGTGSGRRAAWVL